MLPIVLVLLAATSALAAPGINVISGSRNEIAPPRNNGNLVSAYSTYQAFGLVDSGDLSVYILQLLEVVNDIANIGQKRDQALALGLTIGVLGEISTGIPGDACAAASLVDASASGNSGNVRSALIRFAQKLGNSIDNIVLLSRNENAARATAGSRGGCPNGGREYQFESAWTSILNNASPYAVSLINENYCSTKRLYNAFSQLGSNVGAIATATSLPVVNKVLLKAYGPLANFVASIPSGNVGVTAGQAKSALLRAAEQINI